MFSNQKQAKTSQNFCCENCDYVTSKVSNMRTHLLTLKHKKSMFVNDFKPKQAQKIICKNCDKIYKDHSGLWRHKQKCFSNTEEMSKNELVTTSEEITDKELLRYEYL